MLGGSFLRIVSQDGMIDVPYDLAALSIGSVPSNKSSTIYVRSKLLDEKPCVFADYSTKDKALKAMEMLRERYTHMKRVECFSSSLGSNQLETLSHKEAELLGDKVQKLMCFQFPQDWDITE